MMHLMNLPDFLYELNIYSIAIRLSLAVVLGGVAGLAARAQAQDEEEELVAVLGEIKNLNEKDGGHSTAGSDSPFAALKDLLD